MRHVAGFMRHHAGDLIGRVQRHQQTGVEKHMLAFGNESIDRRIVHQMNLNILGHQSCRYQDRVEFGPQHAFGLSVADQRYALSLRVRSVGWQRQQRDHQESRYRKPEKGPQTGKSAFQRFILLRTYPSGGTVGFASNSVNARHMTLSSPSVASPKFAIAWATLLANFGFKATLAILLNLVRLLDLKFLNANAMKILGTSN